MRRSWLILAVVVALIIATATLYLRIIAVYPVYGILYPYGDVPETGEAVKTIYVEVNRGVSYATVPLIGRGMFLTNTSNWYVYTDIRGHMPPAAALTFLPMDYAVITPGGYEVYVYNFNGTHGAVKYRTPDFAAVWAAEITPVGHLHVWHPVVPDDALRAFIATTVYDGAPLYLFVPQLSYIRFTGVHVYIYADHYDGSQWRTKYVYVSYQFESFNAVDPNTYYAVNAIERVEMGNHLAYVYWPTLAVHYNPSVADSYTTYLRVEAG